MTYIILENYLGSAEEKLLANIEEGIKYGALDENIVVTELRELLKATQKGKNIGRLTR